jgi:hypothetical protein
VATEDGLPTSLTRELARRFPGSLPRHVTMSTDDMHSRPGMFRTITHSILHSISSLYADSVCRGPVFVVSPSRFIGQNITLSASPAIQRADKALRPSSYRIRIRISPRSKSTSRRPSPQVNSLSPARYRRTSPLDQLPSVTAVSIRHLAAVTSGTDAAPPSRKAHDTTAGADRTCHSTATASP